MCVCVCIHTHHTTTHKNIGVDTQALVKLICDICHSAVEQGCKMTHFGVGIRAFWLKSSLLKVFLTVQFFFCYAHTTVALLPLLSYYYYFVSNPI